MSAREQNQHEAPIISIKKGGGAESQAVCSLTAPESGAPLREFSFDFAYDDTSDQVLDAGAACPRHILAYIIRTMCG